MSLRDWAEPDRIAYLISHHGDTPPRIIAVYRIDRVNSRYAIAVRTSRPDSGTKDEFRLSDGRKRGQSEYGWEVLYPTDHPLVARAVAARRIRRATADLIGLLRSDSTIACLKGEDFQAAIDLASEILASATHAKAALQGAKERTDDEGKAAGK